MTSKENDFLVSSSVNAPQTAQLSFSFLPFQFGY